MQLTEVTPVSLSYLLLGGFTVVFSMISLLVKEKLYIGEVVLGTAFGVVIGPYCANIFDPRSWGADTNVITLEVMRIVLATGLFAIGVELPKAYLAEHARSLSVMVIPTMAFGWVISAALIHALMPNLNFVSSLAISACLTPTDPILAAAIIGGKFAIKNVPRHIRHILSAESAANDGLAYPFLTISIYLTVETSRRVALEKWFLIGWLYQVILGTVLGSVLGLGFSKLMKISHRKGLIDRESFVAQYLALAIFTIGVASSIGTDDLLAAFAAGSAVSWDGHFNVHTEGEVFSSVIDLLLNCACFIYIGAWLPFNQFQSPELGIMPWKLFTLFIAILFVRRIPSLLLLYRFIPDVRNWREAVFCGHFGPMGVGAVFISTLAVSRLPKPHDPPQGQQELLAATLQPIVAFVVLGSILIHGLSIPAFWFGRKFSERTLSVSATWSRTWTARGPSAVPDWLLWARRTPTVPEDPLRSPTLRDADVERGDAVVAGDDTPASKEGSHNHRVHDACYSPDNGSVRSREAIVVHAVTSEEIMEKEPASGKGKARILDEKDLRSSLRFRGVENDWSLAGSSPKPGSSGSGTPKGGERVFDDEGADGTRTPKTVAFASGPQTGPTYTASAIKDDITDVGRNPKSVAFAQ
ncbi:hypothetical protein BD410DRAFT_784373 [Rickenella mellea]|uniref:Cation/H+ exchanger transmembrane domain-containing protein n=1 Tax=Rickenella mellea TaxID=50990 RepID=A0A4Y7QF47_9AGAM|nr:hypothetical protein BD410DRAFT_784373 [Rickenella mellea]